LQEATPAALSGQVVDLPPPAPARAEPSEAYNVLGQWRKMGLELSDKGVPYPNLDNATALLERHHEMQGRFWYDEFLQRMMSTWNMAGEPREWSDSDDVRLALWMQRRMKIGRMAVGTARDAVTAVAMAHSRDSCAEWLTSLQWDGVERLKNMLAIGFGVEASPYASSVGRCWMVGMVARVLSPGCKVDTMPVFEGDQGRGKSSALQALVGPEWFAEASESPTSKDFYQVLTGKMLVEIAELDAFNRAEVNTIKRVITCQVDRYRAPYGRRAEDHPRRCVFSGTTNRNDWNRDDTGARRFLPVMCGAIDLEWIRQWRVPLFAEAVARFKRGESWWDIPAEDARREQESRRQGDEWEARVGDYLVGRFEVTVGDVLDGALGIKPDKWDRGSQMRVGSVLRVLGWERQDARKGGRVIKVWRAPERKGPLI
jgi:putative DNA primase/helicase